MNKDFLDKLAERQKQKVKLLINRPNFQKAILSLRKKWNIPKQGFQTQNEIKEWYQKPNKDIQNDFLIDIENLTLEQKISPKWINSIKQYLLSNNTDNMKIFIGPTVSTHHNTDLNTKTISIEINEDTTLIDIKNIWPLVMTIQSSLQYKKQNKFQPIKNFERNKKAYNLKSEGKSLNEIADLLSEEYKSDYIYTDVADFIKKYKKSIGIN